LQRAHCAGLGRRRKLMAVHDYSVMRCHVWAPPNCDARHGVAVRGVLWAPCLRGATPLKVWTASIFWPPAESVIRVSLLPRRQRRERVGSCVRVKSYGQRISASSRGTLPSRAGEMQDRQSIGCT
jgi:hypothetical protein